MAYRNTIVFPDNLTARIESARASMQTAAGLPVSFGDAVRALIDDGIPVRRARGWLPGAPDTAAHIAADKAASAVGPAETRTLGQSAPSRNAARDERVAAERARRRALGCECVANHKRACPLRGEHAVADTKEGSES